MSYRCRSCSEKLSTEILNLSNQPPSNAYIKKEDLNDREIYYPLRLYICKKCWLVQLPAHTKAEELFTPDYAYFSSVSSSWCLHAKNYVESTIKKLSLNDKSLVVEIASNDGYLLQYVKENKIPCFGIEPTYAVAQASRAKGITTIEKFFGTALAKELKNKDGLGENGADLIIGNNVLAHVPDINDFLEGFFLLLKDNGVASLEFPHLLRLIKENQFDTIYHEHFSYLSLNALERISSKIGLKVFDVEELSTHGGSLRVWLTKNLNQNVSRKVKKVLLDEINYGLETLDLYINLRINAEKVKLDLLDFLIKAKRDGKKVMGYGAAAKGNTLLNYAGIKLDFIIGVSDKAPSKQGKFLPGSHIPILSLEELKKINPDYIIVFPWNLIDEIKKDLQGYKLVTLIPQIKFWD